MSVLNFGAEPVLTTVCSEHLVPGATVTDMFTDHEIGTVDDLNGFVVQLEAHQGHSLLVIDPLAP